MRVVADTNTVLSAFLWGGPPKAVLDAARAEHITLFSSAALLAELEDVLSREKFAVRITRIETRAGHGAGKPVWMQIEDIADQFGFVASALGMAVPVSK